MMETIRVKGDTYALVGAQTVGLYRIDAERCLLFDPGSGKLRPAVEAAVQAMGLTPVGVACTHMHYDHHESTRYYRETYGAQICLPQLEADIVRSPESLKNHLFNFPMGLIRTFPRLQALCCPVDRVVGLDETSVTLCGVPLEVVRTPGHSPDHACFVTPDGACFAGDVLMTDEVLAGAQVPFVFDMADDLASKRLLAARPETDWIFSHNGVLHGSCAALAERNLARIEQQLAACAALVDRPMTYSGFYAAVVRRFDLPVGHPVRALHLERYIRPYLEYLIDTDRVTLTELDGAPAVMPKEG